MKKLLGGLAVFMFVLVIMAGSASAAGTALIQLPAGMVNNIMATFLSAIVKFLPIFAVLAALRIVVYMISPSEEEIAFNKEQDDYLDYAEKLERKEAFRERYENEHYW